MKTTHRYRLAASLAFLLYTSASAHASSLSRPDASERRLVVDDGSDGTLILYTGLVARYVLAGKCSDAGMGFTPEQVGKMENFIKANSQAIPKDKKDEIWDKIQAAYSGNAVSTNDCSENLKMTRYMFPESVFKSDEQPKNPF